MKILNLYAGIGCNRKLYGDTHEITAVELDPKIAEIYKDFFPSDNIDTGKVKEWQEKTGFNLDKYPGIDKRKALRNCVRPELGLHILNESIIDYQKELFR